MKFQKNDRVVVAQKEFDFVASRFGRIGTVIEFQHDRDLCFVAFSDADDLIPSCDLELVQNNNGTS